MNFFRGRAILWLLIPLTIVVAFLWDQEPENKPSFITEKTNPDYFLIENSTLEFSEEGKVEREFSSAKTLHYLFKKQTVMEYPTLTFVTQTKEQWQVAADKATSKEQTEELLLEGNIVIDVFRESGEQAQLLTDTLLIDFGTETASTKDSVQLVDDYHKMTALGMFADLYQNTLEFKANVVTEEL